MIARFNTFLVLSLVASLAIAAADGNEEHRALKGKGTKAPTVPKVKATKAPTVPKAKKVKSKYLSAPTRYLEEFMAPENTAE